MVFFNDPLPCDDAPRRAVDMAVAMRAAVHRLAQRWSTEGHELALGVGIAQGYATLGRIGFEGRYDYAAIGSVTNLAARLCVGGPAVAGAGHAAGAGRSRGRAHERVPGRAPAARVQQVLPHLRRHRPRSPRSTVMTSVTATAAPGRTLDELDEDERGRRFDELQALMPDVWALMRRDVEDESVVVVPSLSRDDSDSTPHRHPQPGDGGAVPVPAPAASAAAAPDGLRHLDADLRVDRGVLPRAAGRCHPAARPASASPWCRSTTAPHARSAAKLLEHPRLLRQVRELIPNRAHCHLVGYNVTTEERDVALSLGIPIYGCDPRLAALGEKTGCRRLFEEVGIRYPIGVEDLHTADELVGGLVQMRATHPGHGRGHRQAQRRRLRHGQRGGRPSGASRARAPGRARSSSRTGSPTWSWSRRG